MSDPKSELIADWVRQLPRPVNCFCSERTLQLQGCLCDAEFADEEFEALLNDGGVAPGEHT